MSERVLRSFDALVNGRPRDDQARPNTARYRPFGPQHQDVSRVLPSRRGQRPTIVTIRARRRATASTFRALRVFENPSLAPTTSTDMLARNTGAKAVEVYGHSASNPRKHGVAQTAATCGEGLGSSAQGQLMPAITLGEFGTDESGYIPIKRLFTELRVTWVSNSSIRKSLSVRK